MNKTRFKKLIRQGDTVEFDLALPPSQRSIEAQWITDLIDPGSQKISHSLMVKNAVIVGDLDMAGKAFDQIVSFEECEFLGEVHFGFAHFATILSFLKSKFHQSVALHSIFVGGYLNLLSAQFYRSFSIAEASVTSKIVCMDGEFRDTSDWTRCTVDGSIDCSGSLFIGRADFTRLTVRDSAFFRESQQGRCIQFENVSLFDHVSIGRQFDLSGSQFLSHASLNQAKVHQDLFLRPSSSGLRAAFRGSANFSSIEIKGNFEADGCHFFGLVLFETATIGGKLVMRPDSELSPVWFEGDANFTQLHVGNSAIFRSAQFLGSATFTQASIGDFISFSRAEGGMPTRILGNLELPLATIGGQFELQEVKIGGKAEFHRLTVAGLALFDGASVGGDFSIHAASFKDALTFERIGQGDAVTIQGNLDARHCHVSGLAMAEDFIIRGEAEFSHSHFELGATFRGVFFAKSAIFDYVRVGGPMLIGADGQRRSYIGNALSLNDAKILGDLIIENADIRDISLRQSEVNGDCILGGLACIGQVQAHRISVDGSFRFTRTSSGIRFGHFFNLVNLTFAVVRQHLEIQGGWFFGGLDGSRMQIGGSLMMRDRGVHQNELYVSSTATFSQAEIDGQFTLYGGLFIAQLDLSGMTVGKEAFLRPTYFSQNSVRPLVLFGGLLGNSLTTQASMHIEWVICVGAADVESLDVNGSLEVSNARFSENLELSGTRVQRDIVLESVQCKGRARLRQVSAASIWLFHRGDETANQDSRVRLWLSGRNRKAFVRLVSPSTESTFQGGIDLRGIKCDRFEAASWKRLDIQPFDLQPFLEIEKGLRNAGRGAEADSFYITAMKRETSNRRRVGGFWASFAVLLRWFYWLLAGFGVRPLRFLGWVAVLVIVGAMVYSQAGAITKGDHPSLCEGGVTNFDAILLSVQMLVPLGRQLNDSCQPTAGQAAVLPWGISLLSFMDVATFAALESFLGWIVTPVAAAVVFEQLRKKRA